MKVNDIVNDIVKDLLGDFDTGTIVDIYTNRMDNIPLTMFIVDFGDDQVFDRLDFEIEVV